MPARWTSSSGSTPNPPRGRNSCRSRCIPISRASRTGSATSSAPSRKSCAAPGSRPGTANRFSTGIWKKENRNDGGQHHGEKGILVNTSFFVPHDLAGPVTGDPSGPLAGLSAVVKDMYDIAGSRTGGGNPDWLAAQTPARVHAAAVEKILAAGATITGKTVCDEFFYSVAGANAHYGTPVNLRAPGRIPGGSSSGSAAALAGNSRRFPPRSGTRRNAGGPG